MKEKKHCYLCGKMTRQRWRLPSEVPTPRCTQCKHRKVLRMPHEPEGYFRTIAMFLTKELQLTITRRLTPDVFTGMTFWYASPLHATWFGHKEHTIKELTRYCHNTYNGLIYIPSGADFISGCMLLHEAAHLMVGCGNSSNDNEAYLAGWEHAVLQHLKLPLSYWYRWQSVTGNDQTYDDMREEVSWSRNRLERDGLLDNGKLVIQRFRPRARVYETCEFIRDGSRQSPFVYDLMQQYRFLEQEVLLLRKKVQP